MHSLNKLMIAVACALPLLASAQTTNPNIKPADQPRTPLEKEATTQNGQATQYGGPGTDTGDATSKSTKHTGMKHTKKTDPSKSTEAGAPVGAVPTYPAPKTDGTPTSPMTK